MDIAIETGRGTSSEVRELLLQPLREVLDRIKFRVCSRLEDRSWIEAGIDRMISEVKSGRDFLQRIFPLKENGEMALGHYFDALKSPRRQKMVKETEVQLREALGKSLPNVFSKMEELDSFLLLAGDGHYLEHATHEKPKEQTHWATGFFFAMDLRNQLLRLITIGDCEGRKKEHDLKALKRVGFSILRQEAKVGQKTLWVWDKAAVDLAFWDDCKKRGIYFLCLKKENQCLELLKEREIDFENPINEGVLWDHLTQDRRCIKIREIGFLDPATGMTYVYQTSEMTLNPGTLVLLYLARWGIEKIFDETKSKLGEKKVWGTTPEAKQTQASFICMAHNLLLQLQLNLQQNYQIENHAEIKRKEQRREAENKILLESFTPRPWLYQVIQRFSQATYKLIRWLRSHWQKSTPLPQALLQLRIFYAKL